MEDRFARWGESDVPCKDCTLRFSGCHSKCPKDEMEEYKFYGYAAYKLHTEKQRQMRTDFLKAGDALIEIHMRGRRKL